MVWLADCDVRLWKRRPLTSSQTLSVPSHLQSVGVVGTGAGCQHLEALESEGAGWLLERDWLLEHSNGDLQWWAIAVSIGNAGLPTDLVEGDDGRIESVVFLATRWQMIVFRMMRYRDLVVVDSSFTVFPFQTLLTSVSRRPTVLPHFSLMGNPS